MWDTKKSRRMRTGGPWLLVWETRWLVWRAQWWAGKDRWAFEQGMIPCAKTMVWPRGDVCLKHFLTDKTSRILTLGAIFLVQTFVWIFRRSHSWKCLFPLFLSGVSFFLFFFFKQRSMHLHIAQPSQFYATSVGGSQILKWCTGDGTGD